MGLLREPAAPAHAQAHLELVRENMLGCMALVVDSRDRHPQVWSRLLAAEDFQSLWYLRCDVMYLLSQHMGENQAAAKLQRLTQLFHGHIPKAQFASAQNQRRFGNRHH